MATKFYFHAATTSDTGTLPAAGASVSSQTPTIIASGVNRTMNTTIGVAQTSTVLTLAAAATAQQSMICRFLSDPIAAQTISAQTLTVHFGQAESNVNSNFMPDYCLALWRPSTGAKIGMILDNQGGTTPGNTTEADYVPGPFTSTSQTAADGDVLVMELWRSPLTSAQGMAVAYTNTVFYDGTTEASATTNAAYLNFANTVTMFTGSAAVDGYIHRRGPNYRR